MHGNCGSFIIRYEDYCRHCMYLNTDMSDPNNICEECLSCPARPDSSEPVGFRQDPEKEPRDVKDIGKRV